MGHSNKKIVAKVQIFECIQIVKGLDVKVLPIN